MNNPALDLTQQAAQLPAVQLNAAAQISETTAIMFYAAYAIVAVGLVVWLARTLFRNGKVFLANVFEDDQMAESVNHLLVVGFYLLNLGYALTLYKVQAHTDLTGSYNSLISRIGALLLSLGVIHLLNMMVFWRIRNHRNRRPSTPPPPFATPPPPFPAPAPAPYFATPASQAQQFTTLPPTPVHPGTQTR